MNAEREKMLRTLPVMSFIPQVHHFFHHQIMFTTVFKAFEYFLIVNSLVK